MAGFLLFGIRTLQRASSDYSLHVIRFARADVTHYANAFPVFFLKLNLLFLFIVRIVRRGIVHNSNTFVGNYRSRKREKLLDSRLWGVSDFTHLTAYPLFVGRFMVGNLARLNNDDHGAGLTSGCAHLVSIFLNDQLLILILMLKCQLQRCCLIQYSSNISVIQQIKKRGNLWLGIPRALNEKF